MSEDQVPACWERRAAELHDRRAGARPGGGATLVEHPNATLVRHFHELQGTFYAGGPIEPLVHLISKDIRWHVPGRSAIAGDHRGRTRCSSTSNGAASFPEPPFRLEVREIIASGEFVFQRVDGTVSRAGTLRSWETAAVLRVADDRIRECWLLPADQELFDDIWSGAEANR